MDRGLSDNPPLPLATPPRARPGRRRPERFELVAGRPGDFLRTFEMAPQASFGAHTHDTAQLVWPRAGSMRVICDGHGWEVVPGAAVWIPSGTVHDVFAGSSGCAFRSLYLEEPDGHDESTVPWASGDRAAPADPTPLALDGLLVELIDELAGGDTARDGERTRLELVMYDRLRHCFDTPSLSTDRVPLPVPRDERAQRVAVQILQRVDDTRDLDEWGRRVGASGRTLRRVWRNETGLTFQQWRTSVRLRRAHGLLRDGASVSETARSVGYRSENAFSDAFADHHGIRPSKVRRGPTAG